MDPQLSWIEHLPSKEAVIGSNPIGFTQRIVMDKNKNKKLEWVQLTIQDIWEALKTPGPVKNKKKYNRRTKHKGKKYE